MRGGISLLHFSSDMWHGTTFHMLICYVYIFFWWSIFYSLWSFLKWGCSFSFYCILRVFYIFKITVLYRNHLLRIFSPSLWLVFLFSWQRFFCRAEMFNFNEVQLILLWTTPFFGVVYKKGHWQTRAHLGFLLCDLLCIL